MTPSPLPPPQGGVTPGIRQLTPSPSLEGGGGSGVPTPTGSPQGDTPHPATTRCENCSRKKHPGTITVYGLVNARKRYRKVCEDCFKHSVILQQPDGELFAWYMPQLYQRPYHESNALNLLALGTRGTGKSTMMRKDAIIRCMSYPGFKALILRRKIPDLKKSHLRFINTEMAQLDGGVSGPANTVGYYRETTTDVVFKNGSFIQFSHCESLKDVENYLSSEWDLIIFDELSTFPLEMFLTIGAAARSPEDAPYHALVRAGSNWLGIGAAWMAAWFVDKNVDVSEYPDYAPDDYEMQFSKLDQNRYVNREDYVKRLRNLPAHIRKAWLDGERVIEGAYFTNFRYLGDQEQEWHVIKQFPTVVDASGQRRHMLDVPWIAIYRALDWGYFPDPAVCLWIAVLPDGHEIVFKERKWNRKLAKDVAKEIVRESKGMRVVETFCDPSIFAKDGSAEYSIAEQIEINGVPLTPSQNDRMLFGYAVCEHLDTVMVVDRDGEETIHPKLQILEPTPDGQWGCKDLVRTIPVQQMDSNDQKKLAAGEDHWVVALAYYCMGRAMPGQDPTPSPAKRWMQPKKKRRVGAVMYH